MRPLIAAFAAFALLLLAQMVVWRLRRGSGNYGTLLALALGVLVAGLAAFVGLGIGGGFDAWTATMLYGALVLAYTVTYSAVQADSPTMSVLFRIEASGDHGLSYDELASELDDAVLVIPRLEDLVAGGLAVRDGGRYTIAPAGALLARVYIVYRGILRMEKGG